MAKMKTNDDERVRELVANCDHLEKEENKPLAQNGEIILYQPDSSIRLEVLLREDTVWLNRQQIADLFHRDIKTIGKHIQNAKAEELKGIPTVAKFATVQQEGNRLINRMKEFYNLDMILSVGYRVKSPQGIMFRRWATSVLKEYLLRGHAINQRIERLEQRVSKTEEQIGFFRQYPPIAIRECDRYHDRFLIIDDTVYHLGASLKDLGKKLFAFSRMEIPADEVLP